MMAIVELKFQNSDATPRTTIVHCEEADIPNITTWYGAYCAGDRYSVWVEGVKVFKDRNGVVNLQEEQL
jgi:hypothetical protein